MQYSDKKITEDNLKEEVELLCERMGLHPNSFNRFVDKLDGNFKKRVSCSLDEWLKEETKKGDGFAFDKPYKRNEMAFEFGNGFVVLRFEELI
jgi:hypothetical protein